MLYVFPLKKTGSVRAAITAAGAWAGASWAMRMPALSCEHAESRTSERIRKRFIWRGLDAEASTAQGQDGISTR